MGDAHERILDLISNGRSSPATLSVDSRKNVHTRVDKGVCLNLDTQGNFHCVCDWSAGGRCCGVDCELQILADTGCYADFTLPSAPNIAQITKINALYECKGPLGTRESHERGQDLACGFPPTRFPLIIQGPLMLRFDRRKHRGLPTIENSALTPANPPTSQRLELWKEARIRVRGRPDWVFVKLHCPAG